MINQQLKEQYSSELTSLTIIYPNFKSQSLEQIVYNKLITLNPFFKENKVYNEVLKQSTLLKQPHQTPNTLSFKIEFPKKRKWFDVPETTITVKQYPLKDYFTALDITDYKYDVKHVDTLIKVINSGVFGPFQCSELDTYYDTIVITKIDSDVYRVKDRSAFTETMNNSFYHLISDEAFHLHLVRSEKRNIDQESKPTTLFRGDGVVKIPSEALLQLK